MRSIALVLLMTVSQVVHAQNIQQKAILPVAAVALPGAYGSVWTSVLAAYNPTDNPVPLRLGSPGPCLICDGATEPLQPHQSYVWNQISGPIPGMGIFLYVGDVTPADAVAAVALSYRIQDTSRQALSWGTEMPIVRERDLFTTPLTLVNVPTDDRFRDNLRIYDFDLRTSKAIVRIMSMANGSTLGESTVTLTSFPYPAETVPAQIAINDLRTFAGLPPNTTVRVDILPAVPNMRFWAFVSVTNNDTQHVTLITPQGAR